MIRIGDSWDIVPENVDEDFFVHEVRRHWYPKPEWDYIGAVKKCLDTGGYLIFNQCLGYNKTMPYPEYWPSENEWRQRTEENMSLLKNLGANKNNTMLTLVNEPTKYLRTGYGRNGVTDLIWLTNIMHDQIAGRFDLGSGNMEFYDAMVLGDWYRYLCRDGQFEYLLIHIQNSCDTEEHTKEYTDYAYGLAQQYGKKLSCSEATHTGWDVSGSDYSKVLMQLKHAERIGCQDFCVICLNLDTNSALQELDLTGSWQNPCFKVNGLDRSNGHYADLKRIANEKKPIPNIIPIEEDDDMKLVNLKPGLKGGQVRWIQEILMLEYGYENNFTDPFDGKYGNATRDQIKAYQIANGLDPDGVVGINTTLDLLFDVDEKPEVSRINSTDYWDKRLKIMVAYWPVTEY